MGKASPTNHPTVTPVTPLIPQNSSIGVKGARLAATPGRAASELTFSTKHRIYFNLQIRESQVAAWQCTFKVVRGGDVFFPTAPHLVGAGGARLGKVVRVGERHPTGRHRLLGQVRHARTGCVRGGLGHMVPGCHARPGGSRRATTPPTTNKKTTGF